MELTFDKLLAVESQSVCYMLKELVIKHLHAGCTVWQQGSCL